MSKRNILLVGFAVAMLPTLALSQQNPAGLEQAGLAKVVDTITPAPGASVHLRGLLGNRFDASRTNRLINVDETELLAGFRKKPGKQAWIGEHVGKWLHAASLVYQNSRDSLLRAKMDRVVKALLATQEADGYLGTYVPEKRWGLYSDADWDVWVHKYCLLGLLTYYQVTGNTEALDSAKRIGNLLASTFGPGKKSILSAGTHVGMASTSVLEPMVLLYRATGDPKYLEFARYIVRAWDEPGGPGIIRSLTTVKSVRKTANAKAYEMLSNLSGLCELFRTTGDEIMLRSVLIAWEDIVRNRLYITGTGSSHEHWQEDHQLPNVSSANVGETCVTVSWIQFNLQLLRLLGEARFADEIERSVYNHLLGAQKPGGDAWCYYTPLVGIKPYGSETNCCLSSGPRGVALLPSITYGTSKGGVIVNLYTSSETILQTKSGEVELRQVSDYPLGNSTKITIAPKRGTAAFALHLRNPKLAPVRSVKLNGKDIEFATDSPSGYIRLERSWKAGDEVQLTFKVDTRVIAGDDANPGHVAFMHGPLVLAADTEHNPGMTSFRRIAIPDGTHSSVTRDTDSTVADPAFLVKSLNRAGMGEGKTRSLHLTPFYLAGAKGGQFNVWFDTNISTPAGGSLFALGRESRSRNGNVTGEISDGDFASFVVTFENSKAEKDWFALEVDQPVEIRKVVFGHGKVFHDGGWFDASKGKPIIEVRMTAGGPWKKVAELTAYPNTTGKDSAGLKNGQSFSVTFEPIKVVGVRIIGVPAGGDNPNQAFSSCSELQVF